MRRELGYALSLRHTPELRFVADDSIAYSANIAATINRIKKEETAE
jgi:ribosome-binding factor A